MKEREKLPLTDALALALKIAGQPLTVDELARVIPVRRQRLRSVLESDKRFICLTGPYANLLGRSPKARLWGLAEWGSVSVEQLKAAGLSEQEARIALDYLRAKEQAEAESV